MSCFRPLLFHTRPPGSTAQIKPIRFDNELTYRIALRDTKTYSKLACKKCIGCRLAYSRQWANRCLLEASLYKHNYFITLTYNDENVPISDKGINTLKRSDLIKFIHKLRDYFRNHKNHLGIRYFACGEYGEKYSRPHYHILLFNLPLDDLEFSYTNKHENGVYGSQLIADLWGKGFITIGPVNFQTAAYTARYILKKQIGKDSRKLMADAGLLPEFSCMSLRPGIGKHYYDKHKKEIYNTDGIPLLTDKGVLQVKPPVYFDKHYKLENPVRLERLKRRRLEHMDDRDKQIAESTDIDTIDYLLNAFKKKAASSLALKRKLENFG